MTITKIIFNPIIVLIVTIIAVVTFLQLDQTTKKSQLSHAQVAEKEKIVQNMAEKVATLEDQFSEVNSDFYKEKVIRDELLLQKESEIILKLPEFSVTPETNNFEEANTSNLSKWQALFLQN